MNWIKRQLSFANIIAAMALFIALGGVAYAAGGIGGKEIKNHSITGQDIKKGSIPLTALKRLPTGDRGPAGPAGAPGAPGSALAYAHVLANGTLDTARSKNVSASKLTAAAGYYCVTPSVPVKNIIATPADTIGGGQILVSFEDFFTSCPDDAVVVETFNATGGGASKAFYISFN